MNLIRQAALFDLSSLWKVAGALLKGKIEAGAVDEALAGLRALQETKLALRVI